MRGQAVRGESQYQEHWSFGPARVERPQRHFLGATGVHLRTYTDLTLGGKTMSCRESIQGHPNAKGKALPEGRRCLDIEI